ncbi:sigma-70 family RNA polymerase sigma factor [Dehalococcoidia bacterium]|nr:sigma-70 family RNA polymerase sigma factor [Dehalococcoidia bacterium]MCL0077344.1 sigma-70 family RNA polymerase sigma factor [Dehalococcoidia bacterium]
MEPKYGDLFQQWEVTLTMRIVTEFQIEHPWLRALDYDDLLQECLIHWHSKQGRFQEGRETSIKSYMARVLKNKLREIVRRELTDKRKTQHLAKSLESPIDEEGATLADVIPSDEAYDGITARLDIDLAMNKLTPLQKRICELLSEDYPEQEIANMLGRPRRSIRDEIVRIGRVFSRERLQEYLE